MIFRQGLQQPLSLDSDLQHDTAPIGGILPAVNQSSFFTAFAEFNDAVVPQTQSFGDVRNGRFHSVWNSGDMQQKLVLLRMKPRFGGTAFAELEELAKGVSELRQGLRALPVCGGEGFRHSNIISYYDVLNFYSAWCALECVEYVFLAGCRHGRGAIRDKYCILFGLVAKWGRLPIGTPSLQAA